MYGFNYINYCVLVTRLLNIYIRQEYINKKILLFCFSEECESRGYLRRQMG